MADHHHQTFVAYPHNPEVDWACQSVTMSQCPPECQGWSNGGMVEDDGPEPGDAIYAAFIPTESVEHYIRAMDTPSQQLAQEVQKAEESQPPKNMVPAQYHDFRDAFSKETFDELPLWKAWDHTIDLTPGTEPPCSQMFPLSPAEQKELDDFLQENLVNGHIHPSKSPMGAPVFFIKKKEVEYLRLVILKDHVAMDPTKVHGVMEWLTPMKVKEVQSFLGFVNFYWKFIHDFSNITHPLYALTHKTQQWVWGSPEQEAFNSLKKAVTSAPILTFSSQSGCFCLECDTSNFMTGAVLSQVQ